MGRKTWIYVTASVGLMLGSAGGTARGADFYYVLVFGSQSSPKLLRYTHTWATFVRAVGEGTDPRAYALEYHTISWLPQSLDVRVWRPWPEPGVNLDLYQTLDVVYSRRESVTMWGPFLVDKVLYDRSRLIAQIADSGAARYQAIDTQIDMYFSDCIHAVAAVDPVFGRGHYPLIRIGKPASRYIARQVMTRSPIDQTAYDNSWVIPRLGLDRYPIEFISPQQIPRRNCLLCRCPE
jgi:hypothetical protein